MKTVKPIIKINQLRSDHYSKLAAVNGADIYMEIDGKMIEGQLSMDMKSPMGEKATCTITFILPEIKYKGE